MTQKIIKDMVNHPEHYNKGKYETYDVIVDTLGKHEAISYCQGNILKYIMRMWNKNKPLQDAEKAEWYLKAMIKFFYIIFTSISLSVLASVFPSWKASKILPAEVLRYE